MELDDLLKLIDHVSKSKLDDFCYETGEIKLRLKKNAAKEIVVQQKEVKNAASEFAIVQNCILLSFNFFCIVQIIPAQSMKKE